MPLLVLAVWQNVRLLAVPPLIVVPSNILTAEVAVDARLAARVAIVLAFSAAVAGLPAESFVAQLQPKEDRAGPVTSEMGLTILLENITRHSPASVP